jgi:molybdate transport system substrate-binding protein
VKVFCARSMQVAVTALAQTFADDQGEIASFVFEPMGALQARLAAGEIADVLILTETAIDALAQSGTVITGSRVAMVRAPIGVAARDGVAPLDISTADTFTAALKGAHAVALSDPAVGGSAGIYLRELFRRIGLAEEIASKTVTQRSGVAAADCVGRGDADLALSFIPELLQGKDVRVLGPLPPPFGHVTAYAAAISAGSRNVDAACTFIAMLTEPAARETWIAAGFEVD